MLKFSRVALGAALALSVAGGAITAVPAIAKEKKEEQPKPPKLSKPVAAALSDAQKALSANDFATALAKVKEAEAVEKRTADDAYMTNAIKLNIAATSKDNRLAEEAIDGMLASGKVSAEEKPKFLRNLGALALQRGDTAKATSAYEQLVQAAPNDPEAIVQLAEIYQRSKQTPKAIATLRQAIDAAKAAGQTVPENWYKRALALAYDAKLPAETQAASLALVSAYPTASNWRDSLIIFRDSAGFDDQGNLDVMRLMRAAGALNGERDYAEYAETANTRGLPGEAKAVLDEGKAKGMLTASKAWVKDLTALVEPKVARDKASLPPLEKEARAGGTAKLAMSVADGYLGHANYAKAAEMYQLALQKGGVDAATVNTRLGIALALAGRKAEAEAAFKAVQGGARQQLAQYWLAWLSTRTA